MTTVDLVIIGIISGFWAAVIEILDGRKGGGLEKPTYKGPTPPKPEERERKRR